MNLFGLDLKVDKKVISSLKRIHASKDSFLSSSSSEDETEEKSSLADRDWDHPPSNFFQTEYS